jgi:L-arabinose isomerase
LEWALRQTLADGKMQGFTYHFLAVGEEGWLETVPFLAAAKLLADGYGFGGEGDVTSAAAVSLVHALTGAANFTEMFTMDFAQNSILMMHMGEGNWKMSKICLSACCAARLTRRGKIRSLLLASAWSREMTLRV